jgi:hypothetical protein
VSLLFSGAALPRQHVYREDRQAELRAVYGDGLFVSSAPVDVSPVGHAVPRLWPAGGYLTGQDPSVDAVIEGQVSWGSADQAQETGHGYGPYRVVGVVRDATGVPVAGARVMLYRSTDRALVAEGVSNPADVGATPGAYAFPVPDATTTYFVVAYFDGPPQTMGATPSNLLGV